jgi:hypothetical protein
MNHVEIDKRIDIDRIVREVVRRINELRKTQSGNGAGNTSKTVSGTSDDSLVLHNPVITLETITEANQSLTDVNTVVVHQRAVVTPAVMDELR